MGELGQQKKMKYPISHVVTPEKVRAREMEIHIPPPSLLLLLFLHGCPISDNVQSPEEEGGKRRSSYGSKFRSVRRRRGRGWSHILREEGREGGVENLGRQKEGVGRRKENNTRGKTGGGTMLLTFGPFFAATAFSSSSSPLFANAPPPA